MDDILAKLAEPFSPDVVSWRVGSTNADKSRGMALAFIDARDVQDRLDEVCGTGWACEHTMGADGKVTCRIGIKVGNEWVWRSNGAGNTDFEGDKGSFSDAFKRAAVMWRVGRYLYDLKAPWVAIETKGRTSVIAETELAGLHRLLTGKKAQSKANTRADYTLLENALRAAAKRGPEPFKAVWTEWQARLKDWPADWRRNITAEKERLKGEMAGPPSVEARLFSDLAEIAEHGVLADYRKWIKANQPVALRWLQGGAFGKFQAECARVQERLTGSPSPKAAAYSAPPLSEKGASFSEVTGVNGTVATAAGQIDIEEVITAKPEPKKAGPKNRIAATNEGGNA